MKENYSWLKDHSRIVIACAITIVWGSVNHYAMINNVHDSIIVTSINNIELVVLGYYFGSAKKDDTKDVPIDNKF